MKCIDNIVCFGIVNIGSVENMSSRQTTLNPFVRWFATVTLVAWIGAQTLCQAQCLFGACHGESDDVSCHATAAATSHHEDEHAPEPSHQDSSSDASCLTIKSALTSNGTLSLITPQFSLLYTLAPIALSLDAMAIEPVASLSRQARLREWVFTPEVCLGPAFRSNAPPFSSLA